jgi:uncharacterized membrane protein YfcA
MLGTYIGSWLGGLSSEVLQLLVFGFVLLAAAYSMLRQPAAAVDATGIEDTRRITDSDGPRVAAFQPPIPKVAAEGVAVGILTGFVGVGGGFLIVPALVILGHLPMRLAIGTSLVIIAAKSLVGFIKYQHYLLDHQLSVDSSTIVIFTLIGILGSAAGRAINQRLNQHVLKRVFAVFLVLLGGFVIIHEGSKILLNPNPRPALVHVQAMSK